MGNFVTSAIVSYCKTLTDISFIKRLLFLFFSKYLLHIYSIVIISPYNVLFKPQSRHILFYLNSFCLLRIFSPFHALLNSFKSKGITASLKRYQRHTLTSADCIIMKSSIVFILATFAASVSSIPMNHPKVKDWRWGNGHLSFCPYLGMPCHQEKRDTADALIMGSESEHGK
jgi:hypothetical protein